MLSSLFENLKQASVDRACGPFSLTLCFLAMNIKICLWMPIYNRRFPLHTLLSLCRVFLYSTHARKHAQSPKRFFNSHLELFLHFHPTWSAILYTGSFPVQRTSQPRLKDIVLEEVQINAENKKKKGRRDWRGSGSATGSRLSLNLLQNTVTCKA